MAHQTLADLAQYGLAIRQTRGIRHDLSLILAVEYPYELEREEADLFDAVILASKPINILQSKKENQPSTL